MKRILVSILLVFLFTQTATAQQIRWRGIGPTYPGTFSANVLCVDAANKDTCLQRNAAGVFEIDNGTAGTFRDLTMRLLTLTGGTVTVSTPILSGTETFNAVGVIFKLDTMTVTDTNSAAGSLLRERIVGATTVESLSKAGLLLLAPLTPSYAFVGDTATGMGRRTAGAVTFYSSGAGQLELLSGQVAVVSSGEFDFYSGALGTTIDTRLVRVGAGVLGFANAAGTNASLDFSTTTLKVRNAANNADAPITASTGTFSGLTANTGIVSGAGGLIQSVAAVTNGVLINGAPPTFSASPQITALGVNVAAGAAGTLTTSSNITAGATAGFVVSTRSQVLSPADGQFNLMNNANTTGVGLDFGTAGTLKIRNSAQNADGALTASSGTFSGNLVFTAGGSTVGVSGGSSVAFPSAANTGPTLSTSTFANLTAQSNGSIVYCTNCDPALTMATCTSAGAATGAFAFRVNGAWICGG